jgi:prephenate dehydrogenase
MWRDIFKANTDCVLGATRMMRDVIDEFITAIEDGDWTRVEALLEAGRAFRAGLYAAPMGGDEHETEDRD